MICSEDQVFAPLKWLAGKIISEATCNMSRGTLTNYGHFRCISSFRLTLTRLVLVSVDYNNISKFLNRILGIEVELQNKLFRFFTDTLTSVIRDQKRRGAWDMGILGQSAVHIALLHSLSTDASPFWRYVLKCNDIRWLDLKVFSAIQVQPTVVIPTCHAVYCLFVCFHPYMLPGKLGIYRLLFVCFLSFCLSAGFW